MEFTSEDIGKIVGGIRKLSGSLVKFKIRNARELSREDRDGIDDVSANLLICGDLLLDESCWGILEEAAGSLQGLEQSICEIQSALDNIKTVVKIVNVVAAAAALAAAVASKDPGKMIIALNGFVGSFQTA